MNTSWINIKKFFWITGKNIKKRDVCAVHNKQTNLDYDYYLLYMATHNLDKWQNYSLYKDVDTYWIEWQLYYLNENSRQYFEILAHIKLKIIVYNTIKTNWIFNSKYITFE